MLVVIRYVSTCFSMDWLRDQEPDVEFCQHLRHADNDGESVQGPVSLFQSKWST